MKKNYLRVGTLVKQAEGMKNWPANKVLRVAKRRVDGWRYSNRYEYFVVAVDDPPGYGCWVKESLIQPLSPLELLASEG